jgi:hypothetical protein
MKEARPQGTRAISSIRHAREGGHPLDGYHATKAWTPAFALVDAHIVASDSERSKLPCLRFFLETSAQLPRNIWNGFGWILEMCASTSAFAGVTAKRYLAEPVQTYRNYGRR